jgi:hypothetical protein
MRQGIGIRLGLSALAAVATAGLLATPALAGNEHSHKASKTRVITFTIDAPAAAAGATEVVRKSVRCSPGFVYASHTVRFKSPPETTRVEPPGLKYAAGVDRFGAQGEVTFFVSNITEAAATAEFTLVCNKVSTGKAGGHKHPVKPKTETVEVVQPAGTGGAHDVACTKPNKRFPAAVGLKFLEDAGFADKLRVLFLGYPLTEGAFGLSSAAPPSASAAAGDSLIWVVILLNVATESVSAELDVLCAPGKTGKARAGGSASTAGKRHSHKLKHRLAGGAFVTVPKATQEPGEAIVPGEATLEVSCKKNQRPLDGGVDPEMSDPPVEVNETRTEGRSLLAEVANHTGADSTVRLTVLCEPKKTAKARG